MLEDIEERNKAEGDYEEVAGIGMAPPSGMSSSITEVSIDCLFGTSQRTLLVGNNHFDGNLVVSRNHRGRDILLSCNPGCDV